MFGSLAFLIRECWLNLRRQGLMVLACIAIAAISLSIFSMFVLMAWQVDRIVEALPRKFEVHAFTRDDTPRERTIALQGEIRKLPGVAQVRLVPREEAWPDFRKGYAEGKDLDGLTANPLPDKLEIQAVTPEDTVRIAEAVRGMPDVQKVKDGREVLRNLLTAASIVRAVGIGLALLLALGTGAIVSSAIRLTLLARRRDIRVMQLVGATNSFIRLPFVLEGTVQGALGGALACAAVGGGLHYLTTRVLAEAPFINEFRLALDLPLCGAALVAGGALMGLFGSVFSLRKFLHAV
jgi:cell division transport system permease protein